jgi:hypothetical protein
VIRWFASHLSLALQKMSVDNKEPLSIEEGAGPPILMSPLVTIGSIRSFRFPE